MTCHPFAKVLLKRFNERKKVSKCRFLLVSLSLAAQHSLLNEYPRIQFCLNLVMEFSQRSYTIPSNCKGDVYVSGIDAVGWIVWSSRQCKFGWSTLVSLDMYGFFIWSNRILRMILDTRITGFGFWGWCEIWIWRKVSKFGYLVNLLFRCTILLH